MRPQNRGLGQLRPLTFEAGFTRQAAGSVLVRSGLTTVLCTCSVEPKVPEFLEGKGQGWLTAEYGMLPGSTLGRKARDKAGKVDGRSVEIQRLIGRSLRAVVDLSKLGERTLWIDCDVLEADGGTRTAAINGAYVALILALHKKVDLVGPWQAIVPESVAAISVGLVTSEVRLDLEYTEDRDAEVDMNLVMTGSGKFIEVQGAGEEATFTRAQLLQLIEVGEAGITEVTRLQNEAIARLR
jgi:ribonuclease PH